MGRWSVSFRSSDFNGDDRRDRPKRGRRHPVDDLVPPLPGDVRRPCARGNLCGDRTRDIEGAWHPAPAAGPFCPTDTIRVGACAAQLPGLWYLAGNLAPAKGRARVRTAPGPRVLAPVTADALRREVSALTAGWAARVRAIPNLSLSAPERRPGTLERLREDCRVLARFPVPLLALADGWTQRSYDVAESRRAPLDRATARCRLCGRTVTRSPVSGWWWAPASPSAPSQFCDHQAGNPQRPEGAPLVPPELEDVIGDAVIIRGGDGWLCVERLLGGLAAGTEILELQWRCRKVTGHVPPRPDSLDGIPCKGCEKMSSLVRADVPADPRTEVMWSRCTACGDVMDRVEFGEWVIQYDAYVKHGGAPPACRRCEAGKCKTCFWSACGCAAAGHREA